MAIVQTGDIINASSGGSNANTGTVPTSITVPDDAEIIIVGVSGYTGIAGGLEALTFPKGGVDTAMTKVSGGDASTSFWQAAAFYLAAPDTGAGKSIKWDWSGSGTMPDGQFNFSCSFWKGIDTADPVRDSDGAQAGSFPITTPELTAQAGDLIVAFLAGFTNHAEGSVDTWANLTTLHNAPHDNQGDWAWATGSPEGNTTVAASTVTDISQGGLLAIVLKPAAEEAEEEVEPHVIIWRRAVRAAKWRKRALEKAKAKERAELERAEAEEEARERAELSAAQKRAALAKIKKQAKALVVQVIKDEVRPLSELLATPGSLETIVDDAVQQAVPESADWVTAKMEEDTADRIRAEIIKAEEEDEEEALLLFGAA